MPTTRSLVPEDPDSFERFVALKLRDAGYVVELAGRNNRGYDIIARRGSLTFAVEVKHHKRPVNVSYLERFKDFIEAKIESKEFDGGIFVSLSGYSKQALALIQSEAVENITLLSVDDSESLQEIYSPYSKHETEIQKSDSIKYFGVFTCKGGVGKTTVAAHLAGAFALMGYDVMLIDLDPDRNLRKLFLQDPNDDEGDASLYVPALQKGEPGATITVLSADQWDESEYPEVKVVICDCSPVLSENPEELVEKFDYCLVPTMLTPLSVAKNSDVIIRTFQHIREINSKTQMFALLNGYETSQAQEGKNQKLFGLLQRQIEKYSKEDPKCRLIDPDDAKIRQSISLQFWGMHIVDGSSPQLAFTLHGGRSHPRADFLQLAEFLEEETNLDELREEESLAA